MQLNDAEIELKYNNVCNDSLCYIIQHVIIFKIVFIYPWPI